jgi:2-polyprenyl-3-methyl-5-hydroxy-6-metoxy-1,4-benzoquinol methylase
MAYPVAIDLNNENNPRTQIVNKIPHYANVLELGCSHGIMSQALKQNKQARVIGIEQDAIAAHDAENICDYVFVEDLDNSHSLDVLQFEKFDTITLIDVLEHLKNPIAVLQRLKPLLLEEGRLILSVPNVAHVSRRLELLCGSFKANQSDVLAQTHEHFYTSESIQALLRAAGYTVHEMDYTWHDLPDEEIEHYLSKAGLPLTDAALDFFHSNENAAYEFIISASPCQHDAVSLPVTRKLKPFETAKNDRHLQGTS